MFLQMFAEPCDRRRIVAIGHENDVMVLVREDGYVVVTASARGLINIESGQPCRILVFHPSFHKPVKDPPESVGFRFQEASCGLDRHLPHQFDSFGLEKQRETAAFLRPGNIDHENFPAFPAFHAVHGTMDVAFHVEEVGMLPFSLLLVVTLASSLAFRTEELEFAIVADTDIDPGLTLVHLDIGDLPGA